MLVISTQARIFVLEPNVPHEKISQRDNLMIPSCSAEAPRFSPSFRASVLFQLYLVQKSAKKTNPALIGSVIF
jgi:hypothetical protein